jgi:hypothetical protein
MRRAGSVMMCSGLVLSSALGRTTAQIIHFSGEGFPAEQDDARFHKAAENFRKGLCAPFSRCSRRVRSTSDFGKISVAQRTDVEGQEGTFIAIGPGLRFLRASVG